MWEKSSKEDPSYNCIGWALEIKKYIWPSLDYYWPRPKPPIVTAQEFIEVFRDHYDFVQCSTSLYEEGYDKIALFLEGDTPEHASAMRREDGRWVSKLGVLIDTTHDGLDTTLDFPMELPYGPCTGYGTAKLFFKRRRRMRIVKFASQLRRFQI
jgi:hypothetical protein